MEEDPVEVEVDGLMLGENTKDDVDNNIVVDPTDEWSQFRNDMAMVMFYTWRSSSF